MFAITNDHVTYTKHLPLLLTIIQGAKSDQDGLLSNIHQVIVMKWKSSTRDTNPFVAGHIVCLLDSL